MKTNKTKKFNTLIFSRAVIIILFSFLGLYSCKTDHYSMLTQINKDGSCSRLFTTRADSSFFSGNNTNNPFPFHIDSGWKIYWEDSINKKHEWSENKIKRTNTNGDLFVHAQISFPNVDSMAKLDCFTRGDWKLIDTELNYFKKFRWFYTYHHMEEIFPALHFFKKVPITNYIAEKEAKMWFQGIHPCFKGKNGVEVKEYLDDIDKKVEEWATRNLFEEQYHTLEWYMKEYNINMDIEAFLAAKDTIYKLYKNSETEFLENEGKLMDNYFQTTVFSEIIPENEMLTDRLDSIASFLNYFNQSLSYQLIMPGKVVSTNAPLSDGDTLGWKVDAYRFGVYDYSIAAVSRTTNPWVFVVSGLFILLTILLFVNSIRNKIF